MPPPAPRLLAAALALSLACPARARDDRSAFTKAVASARIWGFMEILRNSGLPESRVAAEEVTLIIPIDTAFYRLTPAVYRTLLSPRSGELAARYIRAHVVQGRFTLAQLAAAGNVTTLGGIVLKVEHNATTGATSLNGCRVTLADQAGTPGMFHLIDGFLFTP